MDLTRLSMADLDRRQDEELEALNAKLRAYALLRTSGLIPAVAARLAGFAATIEPARLEKRTQEARAVMTERTNRTVEISPAWLRLKFLALHDDAMQHGDRATARACLTEIGKLAALYPDQRLRLSLEQAPVDTRTITDAEWEVLSRIEHEVGPGAASRTTVEALPAREEPSDAR